MSLYSGPDPSLLLPPRKLRRIGCLSGLVCGGRRDAREQLLGERSPVCVRTATSISVRECAPIITSFPDSAGNAYDDDDEASLELTSPREYRSAALECIVEESGETGSIRPVRGVAGMRTDPRRSSISSPTITPVPSQRSLSLETMQRNMPYDWPVGECGYGDRAGSDVSSSQAEVSDISTEILDAAASFPGDLSKVSLPLSPHTFRHQTD